MIPLDSAVVRFVIPNNTDEVVVTFESALGGIDRANLLRTGFGEKFLLDNHYAVISILPFEANWYRTKDIREFLSSDEILKYIKMFKKIHTYGSSMGAYGALAFADVLGADNVVAISPITTLASDLVPWETRFRPGTAFQWNGLFSDGCEGCRNVSSIWALFDDKCVDANHVERLEKTTGQRLNKLVIPGVRHAVAVCLSDAGVLKKTVLACLQNQPYETVQAQIMENDFQPFYAALRKAYSERIAQKRERVIL